MRERHIYLGFGSPNGVLADTLSPSSSLDLNTSGLFKGARIIFSVPSILDTSTIEPSISVEIYLEL